MTTAGLPYTCIHVSCNEQWLFSGDEQAVLIVLELNPENKTSRNKEFLWANQAEFPCDNCFQESSSTYNKFLPSFCKKYINYRVWCGYWSMSLNQCRTFATTIHCSNFQSSTDQASISQNSRRVFGPGRHFFSSICQFVVSSVFFCKVLDFAKFEIFFFIGRILLKSHPVNEVCPPKFSFFILVLRNAP